VRLNRPGEPDLEPAQRQRRLEGQRTRLAARCGPAIDGGLEGHAVNRLQACGQSNAGHRSRNAEAPPGRRTAWLQRGGQGDQPGAEPARAEELPEVAPDIGGIGGVLREGRGCVSRVGAEWMEQRGDDEQQRARDASHASDAGQRRGRAHRYRPPRRRVA
jgi:hypothetical protein